MDAPSGDDSRLPPAGQDRQEAAGARMDSGGGSLFTGVGVVCETAARLTGVDGAAVAVLTASSRVRELVYATDPIAQQLDELQFTIGEGPCLDAYLHDRPELWAELDTSEVEAQWPGFVPDAFDLGARALFAFPVPGHNRPLGVLELYRRTAGPLDAGEQESATVCAVAVGRTLMSNWDAYAEHADNIEHAIEAAAITGAGDEPADPFPRSQVYVAAGMVAVQLSLSTDDALDRLRAYAYSRRRPITAVSADIVARRLSLQDQRDDTKDG